MQEPEAVPPPNGKPTRAGYVALVGRPNVGKSSLLNALVGEKLSIVTPRAQTTRESVTGILTTEQVQIVFVDTPGLLEPQYALHKAMLSAAMRALHEADVVLLLLDATKPAETPFGIPLETLQSRRQQVLVAINKTDAAGSDGVKELAAWSERTLGREARFISALTGGGLPGLLEDIAQALPLHPYFYPAEDLAVQPVRFFVAELVRETIFEQYGQEVPYASEVRIEEFREDQEPEYIRATIYVERESQKAIVIGHNGTQIRALGERSREKIEAFLGQRIFLDLWVKPLPGWRKKMSTLKYLGYAAAQSSRGDESAE